MSHRYLYKAKRTDNGEWVEGYVSHPCCIDAEKGVVSYYFKALDKIGFVSECTVSSGTICQCTGLKDKNGKLIWENDIVRESGGACGVIRFGKYGDAKTNYGFYIEWDRRPYWRNDICFWQSDIKVISSSIENSELMEDGV